MKLHYRPGGLHPPDPLRWRLPSRYSLIPPNQNPGAANVSVLEFELQSLANYEPRLRFRVKCQKKITLQLRAERADYEQAFVTCYKFSGISHWKYNREIRIPYSETNLIKLGDFQVF